MLSEGNVLFTLIGFMGMYLLLGLVYVILVTFEALRGPDAREEGAKEVEELTDADQLAFGEGGE